jgi:MFS family permease
MKLLLFFIALNIITTTDAGFNAPLIVKMTSVFNVDVVVVSFYLSLLTTIPALLIPIFGILSDKFKRVLIVFIVVLCGALVSVLIVLVILFVQNFVIFAIFGILAGTINIALGPTLFSLIVDYVPAKNRAGVIGWMGIAGTTAIALGFIVSGIIPVSIFGPDFPLWFPYVFDAVSGFLFAGLTLLIKEPPRGIQEEGLSELYAKGESYSYTLTFEGAKDFIRSPINQRLILFNVFSKILSGMLGTYFITFLIINHGFNEATATYIMFAIFGIQLFGQIFWGNKGDKAFQIEKDGHLKIMIKTTLMALFFVTWVFLIPFNFETQVGIYLFLFFAIILAIGSFFGVGSIPSFGAVIAAVNPPEIRGTANSINFLITTVVKSVFLIIFALIAVNLLNNNYSLTFFFFALSYIPTLLVLLTMRKIIVPSIDKVQEKLKAGV